MLIHGQCDSMYSTYRPLRLDSLHPNRAFSKCYTTGIRSPPSSNICQRTDLSTQCGMKKTIRWQQSRALPPDWGWHSKRRRYSIYRCLLKVPSPNRSEWGHMPIIDDDFGITIPSSDGGIVLKSALGSSTKNLLVRENYQMRRPKDECEASVDDDPRRRNTAHGNKTHRWWSLNCFCNDYQRCLSSPKTGAEQHCFEMEPKDAGDRFDFTPTTSKRSRSSTNTTNLMKPMDRFKQVGSIEATAWQKSRWRTCWLWPW